MNKKIILLMLIVACLSFAVGCNDVKTEPTEQVKETEPIQPIEPTESAEKEIKLKEEKTELKNENVETGTILGSTKDEVKEMFSDYKKSEVYDQASGGKLIFENKDMSVIVYFDSNGIAEGVVFTSAKKGQGFYVKENRDKLIKQATGGKDVKVLKGENYSENELFIGNIHR